MGKLAIVYVLAYSEVDLKNARRFAVCVGTGRSVGVTVTLVIRRVRMRIVVNIRVGHGCISVWQTMRKTRKRDLYTASERSVTPELK